MDQRLGRFAAGILFVLLVPGVAALANAPRTNASRVRLSDRVLRANELPGFAPARVQTARNADAWARIAPSALMNVASRLRKEGFVGAVREDLIASSNDRGALSIVVQVRDRRAANTELALQLRDYSTEAKRLPGHTYKPFGVPAIPGAHGFTGTDPSGGSGINVIFADGAFTYHIGAGYGAGAQSPPTRAAVVRAAARLYNRVHGN
jgi:hypothetical protein